MATNKERLVAALKKKNPNKKYEDEEEIYGDAMSGYDEVRGRLTRFQEDDAKAMQLLSQNPDVQNFLAAVLNGGDFGTAMAQLPDYAKMSDTEKKSYDDERKRKLDERKSADERQALKNKTFRDSVEQIKLWSEENGISVEDVLGAIEFATKEIFDKLDSGNLDKDFIEMLFRLKNYDNDIKASKEAGILEGRNLASAETPKRRKEGDGLPTFQSSGGQQKGQPTADGRGDLAAMIARNNKRNEIFGQ